MGAAPRRFWASITSSAAGKRSPISGARSSALARRASPRWRRRMARRPALGNDPFVRGAPVTDAGEATPPPELPIARPVKEAPRQTKPARTRPLARQPGVTARAPLAPPVARRPDLSPTAPRAVDDFGLSRGFVDRWQPRLAWLLQ